MANLIGRTGRATRRSKGTTLARRIRALAAAVLAGVVACTITSQGWAQARIVPPVKVPGPIGGGVGGALGGLGSTLTLKPNIGGSLPSLQVAPPTGFGGGPPDDTVGTNLPPVTIDDYIDDILVSDMIAEYGKKSLIIRFHPDRRIRVQAMQGLLESIYKKLLTKTAALAVEVITAQKADLEQELAEVEDRFLSVFYWQTTGDLRRNIEEIVRGESEVEALERQARNEARERAQSWDPNPDWSIHGSVKISTGPAFQQLQHISIHGWGGS